MPFVFELRLGRSLLGTCLIPHAVHLMLLLKRNHNISRILLGTVSTNTYINHPFIKARPP
jgi:hypothetical protein